MPARKTLEIMDDDLSQFTKIYYRHCERHDDYAQRNIRHPKPRKPRSSFNISWRYIEGENDIGILSIEALESDYYVNHPEEMSSYEKTWKIQQDAYTAEAIQKYEAEMDKYHSHKMRERRFQKRLMRKARLETFAELMEKNRTVGKSRK